MMKWIKIKKGGDLPELGELILLHDGMDFFTGKMFVDGDPPLWRYYSPQGEIPTRDFEWWTRIPAPISGGPVTHRDGTTVGALKI